MRAVRHFSTVHTLSRHYCVLHTLTSLLSCLQSSTHLGLTSGLPIAMAFSVRADFVKQPVAVQGLKVGRLER